jgi:hypothetical protein
MTPDQKGSIAEIAVMNAAVKLGIGVLKPMTDGERYDLVFDLRPRLVRVQCKWAVRFGDVVTIRCRSSRRGRDGYVRRSYSSGEIDAFAAYCAELDRCYYVPIERFDNRREIRLRLVPTRNNQERGINWAEDFQFEATLSRLVGP